MLLSPWTSRAAIARTTARLRRLSTATLVGPELEHPESLPISVAPTVPVQMYPETDGLERAKAYAAAGASGFFIPGLTEDALIEQLCEAVSLPVNVMVMDGVPSNERLVKLGVARISYGPIPYVSAMRALQQEAKNVFS